MKQFQFLSAGVFVIILFFSCHRGNSISIINDNDKLYINYNGEVRFNNEENAILAISRNGFIRYIHNEKKLRAENGANGEIKYEMEDDGRKISPESAEGKRFLEDVVKDMIDMGFDAKGRMERLYNKGGASALLNEVQHLKMDYIKNMYLEYLLSVDSISQDQIKSVARKISTEISSDYDKGRLLQKFPVEYLRDSLTARAWFESVKGINADYEKSNTLVNMARQDISKAQINQIVDVVNSMQSDYEKSNVLKELIFKRTFAEENFDRTLDAISYVNADYEKVNLLKALIEKEKPSADHFNKLLDVTEHVNSDFDKANLIKEMIETGLPAGASFDKLLSAVVHTNSEFDRTNLLKDVIMKNISSQDQWISVINATASIESDYDKSNFLVTIAPDLPKTDSVKMAYLKVARTISQESDLGRAVKAME
ncbi:MAG TPA: hypothetical protein VMT76_10915 [Puia sp.]|nr:hypothetical protein [Puia sp.]